MDEKIYFLISINKKKIDDRNLIGLICRDENGKRAEFVAKYNPYFFVIFEEEPSETFLEELKRKFSAINIEKVEFKELGHTYKIFFENTYNLTFARREIVNENIVKEIREFDIPFTKRYAIDKNIEMFSWYKIRHKEKYVESIEKLDKKKMKLKIGCFDIETSSLGKFSDASVDEIISICFMCDDKIMLFTTKDSKMEFCKKCKDEKGMLEEFFKVIEECDPDVIVTYNGDGFDFPYIIERAKILGIKNKFLEKIKFRHIGEDTAAFIEGIQHLDAFKMLILLKRLGVVNLIKFDLESVVESLFGVKKEKLSAEKINLIWNSDQEIEKLLRYNLEDVKYTLKIAKQYLPILIELCKITKMDLFEVCRSSASGLVENLLLSKIHNFQMLAPNKPKEDEVRQRMMQTYEGGFVKEPLAGLHENIVVVDFRSLHPSIIISHNISPETLCCKHEECKEKNLAPNKKWFCTKARGFLPDVVKELLEKRIKIKKEMKNCSKEEYQKLYAEQYALKILMNSHYGYLAYVRSRWYCKECASAVTAWSRYYVNMVIEKAEREGFKVLYGDTDSAFLIIPAEKKRDDVYEFVKKINENLPESMELEIDGFYKRGIFVTRKEGSGAAKKRYALIDYENKLKIVGFEYVRRDWAPIAKETQRKVIELILKEGNPEKAADYVREVIKRVKNGLAKKEELIILTQIKKSLNSYDVSAPHVAAAKKAIKRGLNIGIGSTIGYIITKSGKKISDKAELEEFVKEGNYDAEYYIKNQIIPAVIKILQELGFNKEDLIQGGKQSSLKKFW